MYNIYIYIYIYIYLYIYTLCFLELQKALEFNLNVLDYNKDVKSTIFLNLTFEFTMVWIQSLTNQLELEKILRLL